MLFIPLAIGAGLGALGGFLQGRQGPQTTTTRSQLNPYGGTGNLDFILGEARNIYDQWQPPGMDYSQRAYRQIYGRGGDGQGGAGGGGGGGGGQGVLGPPRRGGGGGGRRRPQFLNWQAEARPELQAIISGENLDIANNPYVNAMLEQQALQQQTAFERALPGIQAQFAASGRYGSGGSAAQQALAQGEMQRALGMQQAGTQMDAYNQAMQQQTAGLGMLSQETMAGRNAWQQDVANRRSTAAQRHAANLQYAANMAQVAASRGNQAAALAYQKQADQMRYALQMDQLAGQQGMAGWQNLQNLYGMQVPIMGQFGEQTQTSTGPPPNMMGSILGGALGGLGIGGMFGGGGGNPWDNFNTLPFAPGGAYG